MSTSIRGDDSFWAETNAAVDGTRSHLSRSGGGVQVFPPFTHVGRRHYVRWHMYVHNRQSAFLFFSFLFFFCTLFSLFFFFFFVGGGGGGHERDERRKKFKKKEENGKKRRKKIIIACVLSSNVKRTFVRSDDDDDDERKTNKTERTGEENTTRSPFRILIQHHQTLVPSFVEWWCFSA